MTDLAPEITALHDAASRGDPGAGARLEAHYRALHGEGPVPPATAATGDLSAAMADSAFMQAVHRGDQAAVERWQALHRDAYPEPLEDRPPLDPAAYSLPPLPPDAEPVEGLEQTFRAAASSFGLAAGEASDLVASFYDVSARTSYMTDADVALMAADALIQLRREPGTLQRAQSVYARLRSEHPMLADALEQSGATSSAPFIRLLARHG